MFPTLVAAMAVVAAVCVMGVSYFAWNSRKQRACLLYTSDAADERIV